MPASGMLRSIRNSFSLAMDSGFWQNPNPAATTVKTIESNNIHINRFIPCLPVWFR
jgi:hypothetical protein